LFLLGRLRIPLRPYRYAAKGMPNHKTTNRLCS
jgi:hypothetical protein